MENRPVEMAVKPKEDSLTCDVCGRADAVEIGIRVLCPDCYQGCGSCCSDIDQKETKA